MLWHLATSPLALCAAVLSLPILRDTSSLYPPGPHNPSSSQWNGTRPLLVSRKAGSLPAVTHVTFDTTWTGLPQGSKNRYAPEQS